jgi:predicted MFS family arabinose efflux permease
MLLLPITMAVVGVSVFSATVPQMQAYFKYVPNGDYLVNFLQTMPGIWIVLFSPVAGLLADRYGRKRILVAAMIIYAIIGTSPFFLNNIYAILVTRCGVGICESVVMTITTTMIADYFRGKARERYMASQTAVASLAALVVIPVGGLLGAKFGWHGPFLVYLYSLVLVLGVAVFCWEPKHESASDVSPNDADSKYVEFPFGRIIGICAITVVGSVMFYSNITQNGNALAVLGVTDPAQIGYYITLGSIGVPVGTIVFWGLARLPIGWLLFVDFLLIGVGFTWMAHSTVPSTYVWAANLQQIGCGLVLPTLLVWATRGLAYGIRGRATGMWQGAFGVGLFVSGATLTLLGRLVGGLLPGFGVLGVVCFVTAATAVIAQFIWGRQMRAAPATPAA